MELSARLQGSFEFKLIEKFDLKEKKKKNDTLSNTLCGLEVFF